jgi:hypothetical protein
MKYLEYIIWIFGILGGIAILLGAFDFVFDIELFKVNHDITYFQAASSFLLVSISCTLYLILKQKQN